MGRLVAKELKILFVETLASLDDFSYEEGNPFLMRVGSKGYHVFLKNLSPAFLKSSPDVTRVQLPYSRHFSKILKSEFPFLILGYDVDSEVFVSWNPASVKERLNAKDNVSLYSRRSLQNEVRGNNFKTGYLTNGERIILFKRGNLPLFLQEVRNLFKRKIVELDETKIGVVEEPTLDDLKDKLCEISDKDLLSQLKPLLEKNQVLLAVQITFKYYSGKYKDMVFKDWYRLVSDLHRKMSR
jgi:hypothetical protein